MRTVVAALTFCFASCLAATAFADRVVLKDGQVFEGVVSIKGNTVEVKMDLGVVGFQRDEVKSIEKSSSPIAELEKRRAAIARTDVRALSELAAWAEKNGLEAQARGIYQQILDVAPEDETARARLGFKKIDGKWMSEDEEMIAKGMVKYLGRWVTKEEAKALEDEETARREKRARQEETARADKLAREREEAARAASAGDEVPDYPQNTQVRMDNYYWMFSRVYSLYDAATSPLYVVPWMRRAIFFPAEWYPAIPGAPGATAAAQPKPKSKSKSGSMNSGNLGPAKLNPPTASTGPKSIKAGISPR